MSQPPEEPGGWGLPDPNQPGGPLPPYNPNEPGNPYASQTRSFGTGVGGFFAGVGWTFVGPLLFGMPAAVVASASQSLGPVTSGVALLGVIGLPLAGLFSDRFRRFCSFMLLGMAVTLIVAAGACVAILAVVMSSN